jgi:hypothetical protein
MDIAGQSLMKALQTQLDPDRIDEHEAVVRSGRVPLQRLQAAAADDPDDAPAEAEGPWLREVLGWAVQALAEVPPRQDPQASWQRFVETQVEVAPEAAVDAQTFLMTYFRWCPSHGELALAEARVLAALQAQGVEVRTGARSGAVTVVGVRLVG